MLHALGSDGMEGVLPPCRHFSSVAHVTEARVASVASNILPHGTSRIVVARPCAEHRLVARWKELWKAHILA